MCGWTWMLQFSWNGMMLRTDVTHGRYITQLFFALLSFIENSTCYAMVLHYMSVSNFS